MIRELFPRYQKEILSFCNTEFGKEWLQDSFGGKILKTDRVVKVAPDGFHLLKDFKDNKPIIEATFFSRSPYINKFSLMLESLRLAEEAKIGRIVQKQIFNNPKTLYTHPWAYFNTGTFNPDAHPETTTMDFGTSYGTGSYTTWANIRGQASGLDTSDSNGNGSNDYSTADGANWGRISRDGHLFDTSSLTASALISSAVYSLYSYAAPSNKHNVEMAVVSCNPASNTSIDVTDYALSHWGSIDFTTRISFSSLSSSGYQDFTLNSSGISNINKTSISKFGIRTGNDVDGTTPSSATSGASTFSYRQSDFGSNKPKLVVVYTLPGSSISGYFEV